MRSIDYLGTGRPWRRMMLFSLIFCLLVLARTGVDAGASGRLKVMFLGDSGGHQPAERLKDLATPMLNRDIELFYTEDLNDLNEQTLSRYDALLIYANHTEISPDQEAALLGYVEGGGGLIAVHSASFCFLNSEAYINLVGGQFHSHGAEVFSTQIAEPEHEIMQGYEGFESWDETYVHSRHNEENRTVLTYRERSNGDREPYTWIRTQREGRVFYTAWGHDQRTWEQPQFHEKIERGIRWAVGQDVQEALAAREIAEPFEYDPDANVAFYPPGTGYTGDGTWDKMQLSLSPEESMKRIIVPAGFRLELFAAEPDIRKPITMNWDERGRLWIAETADYPNELRPEGEGRDRITILEDTTGDGKADKYTVFAENLSIPTSLIFANGGVVVHQAPQTLFLKDTTGDDKADVREVLFDGWNVYDTHAGPSNLRYGFDNWLWSTQGYAGFNSTIGGEEHEFGMGIFRFKPDGSKLEFMRATNNNTWGLGIAEDGGVFVSTANNNPSGYMPFANRYYERLSGLNAGRLGPIADRSRFLPITHRIRQVDVHGGYTSAAGHALYTARSYPKEYWNRIAFITDPTGNLVGEFVLEEDGSGFRSYNPRNLLASDDEWMSPIVAEVGPDGSVWMIDWYNYIVQHNPTPQGWETGAGNAYETELRDKRHGRIYRIVWEDAEPAEAFTLHDAEPAKLVETLSDDNLFWRQHAQRLLVERGEADVAEALIAKVNDDSIDEIGLNVGAIHAIWTLHGLKQINGGNPEAMDAVKLALSHPSAAVRRNAVQVLPAESSSVEEIVSSNLLNDGDAKVRLQALIALADLPASLEAGKAIYSMLEDPRNVEDRWIREAGAIAAHRHATGFMESAITAGLSEDVAPEESANLIANSTFDNVEDGQPVGWGTQTWAGSADHEFVEGGGRNGSNAVKITSTEGADTAWTYQVAVKPGARYRLIAWVRPENIDNSTGRGVQMNIHGFPASEGGTNAVSGTEDWSFVEVEFTNGNQTNLQINCLFGGWGLSTGTAWYDEVSLVEIGPARGQSLIGIAEMIQEEGIEEIDDAEEDVDVVVIELGVTPDVMKFDKEELRVPAGAEVRVVFRNTDHMQHNVLFIRPGTLEEVGAMADAMLVEADAQARHYVPDTDNVWAASPVVDPYEEYVMTFTAPEEPGEYPYVCTFPGHWRIMHGILIVE